MSSPEVSPFHVQLFERRSKLEGAITAFPGDQHLHRLLEEVDSALARLENGSYGFCEVCNDPIEIERLAANPLEKYCLDHLTPHQQQALEDDLFLAHRIQGALLPPRNFQHPGWEVSYCYEGAGLVSGDYCDLLSNDEGQLLFMVGDVAGKGVAASMLMAHLQAMFRALVSQQLPLDRIFERASRIFCESTLATHYATLVAGRAHASGELDICNAGHLSPLIVKEKEIRQVEATGLPLGMFCEGKYTMTQLKLSPGDIIILHTDGITEARNSAGAEYGGERLVGFLKEHRQLPVSELIAACIADLKAYRAISEDLDDITIMAIQRAV